MSTLHNARSPRTVKRLMFGVLMLSLLLLASACGSNPQTQQQASQQKSQLDKLLQHAQFIGVPLSALQSIIKQENDLTTTSAPASDPAATDYYKNLATRYQQLQVQVQGIIATTTQQYQTLAQKDMQDFQVALAQIRSQGIGNIQVFSAQFSLDQQMLASAQYPKDYAGISIDASKATNTLDLIPSVSGQLTAFKNTITKLQQVHLDTTALQSQYNDDLQILNQATVTQDLQNLSLLINGHYQQAVINSIQVLPYISAAKLDQLKQQIDLLKSYGMDTSAYQKLLDNATVTMGKANSIQDFLAASKQIDADIASMHDDFVRGEAHHIVQQFHQEVDSWANAHPYHDTFDGQNYALDSAYQLQGIGSGLDQDLAWAYTLDDFQNVINETNNALFNLHMLEADYSDKTPYDQVHATDLQMIDHYKLQQGQLLMISLVEQTMRVYQDGKLVKAFYVTTGRSELPSIPGVWSVMDRLSPTTFKSPDPPGSPYWYPDTPINYAILYHWGGYFVHDSWWRADYGPGTQFPHYDSGGDESFAGDGSHGCVNMQEQQAAWVYNNTNWNTLIVIY